MTRAKYGNYWLFEICLNIQPLKMELTQGSETSAYQNLKPGRYPKEHTQYSRHGESLKSSICLNNLIYHIEMLIFITK
jgi:hypothetical protein